MAHVLVAHLHGGELLRELHATALAHLRPAHHLLQPLHRLLPLEGVLGWRLGLGLGLGLGFGFGFGFGLGFG